MMKIKRVAAIFILGILLVAASACGLGPEPTPTPTPTATPTPLPTVTMSCEEARDAIQAALDAYHDETGEWPTSDGQPGDIEWTELVPDFMAGIPANDSMCKWQVNSDPLGEVCLLNAC